MKKFIVMLFVLSITLYSQQSDYMTVTGDSLVGRLVSGETIREVYGNVILTQGDVVITCQRAVQYISRNEAELIGNVVVKQDSLTIETPRALYLGNRRIAQSTAGVRLNDMKVILTADEGDYYFNEDMAYFRNNVNLHDTVATLTSDELTYYKNEDRMIAVGGVKILDPENIIRADSLEYFRIDRITYATNNVSIRNLVNNIIIFGDHLEDYAQEFYTLIDRNPLLMQIDTSYVRNDTLDTGDPDAVVMVLDTLLISSLTMESFRDTMNTFYARDSVQIWRGSFASRNNYTVYYRNEDLIVTRMVHYTNLKPALWQEDSQLTGDSINIHIRENRIRLLEIYYNAFLLSESPLYKGRYDQVSGERIFIHFEDGIINKTEVFGNLLSIYYLYEDDETNGLSKFSASSGVLHFIDKKVSKVNLHGSPASEYHPENQVAGKELSFTLPAFTLYINRPTKEGIIAGRRNIFNPYLE
jgi:lipopolysaccharide export system protein LptA